MSVILIWNASDFQSVYDLFEIGWLVGWFIHLFHLNVHCRFPVSRHCSIQWDNKIDQVPLFAKACDLLSLSLSIQFQFSHSVVSNSLRPHESQHARPPCPPPTPGVHSDSWPSSRWCHPAISSSFIPSPPAPNPSRHQGLFQWVNSLHEVAKVLEFQLQHHSFQWTPRTDLL